jgi:Mn2+/Fe2+ NRAMP family transporter
VPGSEGVPTYWYYAISLFGAAMTPYEVFFFSSGAVEEKWSVKDLPTSRLNVFVGFPLGGLLSLSIAACAALVLLPAGIEVETLGQTGLPVSEALGRLGLAVVLLGFFAATFGAACETGLSVGYSISQYFGWQWGKYVRPKQAALFHITVLISAIIGVATLLTTVMKIITSVNMHKDHIPPITTTDTNPFPYQIHVGLPPNAQHHLPAVHAHHGKDTSTVGGWATRMGIY